MKKGDNKTDCSDMNLDNYYDRNTIGKYYCVSITTVREWEKRGLPCIRIGGAIRYRFRDVVRWVEEQNDQSTKQAK